MKKKFIIIALIIIVLLILGCFIYLDFFNQSNVIKVGNSNFTIPDGYHKGEVNEFGALSITNGSNSIYLSENNGTDVQGYINIYGNILKEKNESINVTSLNIDNFEIFKVTSVNNTNNVHYFFINNNKTYDIYTWGSNDKLDRVIINLIESL